MTQGYGQLDLQRVAFIVPQMLRAFNHIVLNDNRDHRIRTPHDDGWCCTKVNNLLYNVCNSSFIVFILIFVIVMKDLILLIGIF